MQTIWKFELPFGSPFKISMPLYAEILCIQQDQKTGILCLWALVNPDYEKEERVFCLFGTGGKVSIEMGYDLKYVGTYQYQEGRFIGHIFERIVRTPSF